MSDVQSRVTAYLSALEKKYETNPASIPESQRKIVGLYVEEKNKANDLVGKIQQIQTQIGQANKQIEELKAQALNTQGRASAFLQMIMPEEMTAELKAVTNPQPAAKPAEKTEARSKKKTSKKKAARSAA